MANEPETLTECRACGNGAGRDACGWCGGLGTMNRNQVLLWRVHEQRRRAASSSYALVETLVRDAVGRVARTRPGAPLLVEADALLDKWRKTESMSPEREDCARELRRLHRQLLDILS